MLIVSVLAVVDLVDDAHVHEVQDVSGSVKLKFLNKK